MKEILKTPQAETDLLEIWLYIAQDNPAAADRFLEKLSKRVSCW
jgi:toxin ParE1/3/4